MAYGDEWDKHFERRLGNVLAKICRTPGIDGTTLTKQTQSLTAYDRQTVLDQLAADGKIRVEWIQTSGRPRKLYWPILPESRVTHPDAPQRDEASETPQKLDIDEWMLPDVYQSYCKAVARRGGTPVSLDVFRGRCNITHTSA
jgi:hypothetical protein